MDIKRIVLWRERKFEKINEQKRGTEEKRTKYFTVLYQLRVYFLEIYSERRP